MTEPRGKSNTDIRKKWLWSVLCLNINITVFCDVTQKSLV
jgi:hypothetical protein